MPQLREDSSQDDLVAQDVRIEARLDLEVAELASHEAVEEVAQVGPAQVRGSL